MYHLYNKNSPLKAGSGKLWTMVFNMYRKALIFFSSKERDCITPFETKCPLTPVTVTVNRIMC